MINKLYKKVGKFIKENFFILLFFTFLYLLVTVKLPYSIYATGGVIDTSDRLDGIVYKSDGKLNLTYVTFIKGTIPMLTLAKVLPSWDIVKNSDITLKNEDLSEQLKRDKISLQSSLTNSIYVGYTYAGVNVNITKENNIVYYVSEEAKTDLLLGDEIESFDGHEFISYEDLTSYIKTKNIGDLIKFKVVRNKKSIDCEAELINYNGETKIGVVITKLYEYNNEPDVSYSVKYSESGSSGGLMMSLAIYNSLTEDDITKGLNISGTGTIDLSGNVGEIGGVKYKLAGAVKNNSDVFLVPSSNYEEALKVKKDNNYKIKIIEATTFEQVLEDLNKLKEKE